MIIGRRGVIQRWGARKSSSEDDSHSVGESSESDSTSRCSDHEASEEGPDAPEKGPDAPEKGLDAPEKSEGEEGDVDVAAVAALTEKAVERATASMAASGSSGGPASDDAQGCGGYSKEQIRDIAVQCCQFAFSIKGLAEKMREERTIFLRDERGRLCNDLNGTVMVKLAEKFNYKIPTKAQLKTFADEFDKYMMNKISGKLGEQKGTRANWLATMADDAKRLLLLQRRAVVRRTPEKVPPARVPEGRPGFKKVKRDHAAGEEQRTEPEVPAPPATTKAKGKKRKETAIEIGSGTEGDESCVDISLLVLPVVVSVVVV